MELFAQFGQMTEFEEVVTYQPYKGAEKTIYSILNIYTKVSLFTI